MRIEAFKDLLFAYNRKVNLFSRQSTRAMLDVLVNESLLLKSHISSALIIDAGSGGGLLGIPLAIALPEKKFVLVETIHKKTVFLQEAVQQLQLDNASIWEGPVHEFMHHQGRFESTIISRGFPRIEALADLVFQKKAKELILISSPIKIKKIGNHMANYRLNRYNIPSRDNLVIVKLENVSRETH